MIWRKRNRPTPAGVDASRGQSGGAAFSGPKVAGASAALQPPSVDASRRRQHRPNEDHERIAFTPLLNPLFDRVPYVSALDLQELYYAEIERRDWWPLPWATVARALSVQFFDGRKTYRDLIVDGRTRRVRVYLIPGRGASGAAESGHDPPTEPTRLRAVRG